jgi:tRNA(Ile)-lysidine synthase
MRPSVNKIIRPLLFATREKITTYCSDYKIPFREDKSNAETRYTRNKIRHLLIPLLKEINPSIEDTLIETSEKLAGVDEILSGYITRIKAQLSITNGKTIIFDVEKLLGLGASKALLYEIFSPFGITGATSEDLIRILTGGTGKQVFSKTHRIVRNRNELIVIPLEKSQQKNHIIKTPDDLFMVPGILDVNIIDTKTGFTIPDKQNIACIDFEKIKFPALIRTWQKGDYFFPLGMKEKKKLSDYFIDRKFSLLKKEEILILESEGRIVWIIGERIDDRFRVTETTLKILRIEAVM